MENRRFILICALGVLLFLVWQAWQQDQARFAAADAPSTAFPADPQGLPSAIDAAADASRPSSADELPSVPARAPTSVADAGEGLPPPPARVEPGAARQDDDRANLAVEGTAGSGDRGSVVVETDVLRARISLTGGDLRSLELLDYPESLARPQPLPLLSEQPGKWAVIQSGVLAPDGNPATQRSPYRAERNQYRLEDGDDAVTVRLVTEDERGVVVEKRYRFRRGDYLVDLEHEVHNRSAAPIDASAFIQLWREDHILGDQPPFAPTFTGYGFYEARDGGAKYRFEKISFSDVRDEPLNRQQPGGWLAMMQHYFIIAAIPPADQRISYAAKPARSLGYLGQLSVEPVRIEAGASQVLGAQLFVGPKLQKRLDTIAPGFDLTIDYGILTPISVPLFWVLDLIHRLLGNWGWAIVALTLLVKGAMYKLSEAQFRSFGKMRHFAPRIQELRERYGDDRQRLNQAMMDLYKKEGFNPLGGCLPMLVQFPVFIALYWVLLESVELRQAPFVAWINDLSVPDPFYILPLLFGASMWLQQKLSGQMATMEPMQQRIMMAMPILLTAFFTLFPAGLVLYWFVSNLVSIAQQTWINRKLDAEMAAKKVRR